MTDNSETTENKADSERKQKKEKNSEAGYGKILITALVTALLTSVTQYFLQNSKMSGEQEYWKKRYNVEYTDKVNSQRLQLIEDINKGELELEIQAKEIKIAALVCKYSHEEEEAKNLTKLLVQYHKDLYVYSAKLQMAAIYFGKEVNNLIPSLERTLELNFNNNLLLNEFEVSLPESELNFETIDKLRKSRIKLLKAMINEISKSNEARGTY